MFVILLVSLVAVHFVKQDNARVSNTRNILSYDNR